MRITEKDLRQIIHEEIKKARIAPMGSLKTNPYYPPRRAATGVKITSLVYDVIYNDPGTRTQQWEATGVAEVGGKGGPRTVQFTTGGGSFLSSARDIIENIATAIGDASGLAIDPKKLDPGLDGHLEDLLASLEASQEDYESSAADMYW